MVITQGHHLMLHALVQVQFLPGIVHLLFIVRHCTLVGVECKIV